jgi:hypothetical protein
LTTGQRSASKSSLRPEIDRPTKEICLFCKFNGKVRSQEKKRSVSSKRKALVLTRGVAIAHADIAIPDQIL